jgi:hypothetical protein
VPVGRLLRAFALLALACASLLGSVAVAEAIFRVYERHFLIEEVRIGADDFDLAKLGYNDAEGFVAAAKPEGTFRILSFGDSFAESATRGRYAYAEVLARALTEASGRPVRVVNFGVSVTSFLDYVQEERTWGERIAHDAVLFNIYAGNDFFEVPQYALFVRALVRGPQRRGSEEVRLVGLGVEIPHRYPLRLLDYVRAQYLTQTTRAESAPTAESELYRPRMPMIPRAYYAKTQARMAAYYGAETLDRAFAGALYGLDTLVSRAVALERKGVRVALSVAPPDFAVSRQWFDAVLAERGLDEFEMRLDLPDQVVSALARRRGFAGPIVVFHECLREAEAQGQDTYLGTNTHWNVRGNEIVGRVYAERLAAAWDLGKVAPALPTPPPCPSEPPTPDPDVVRWLDRSLQRLDAAERLRNQVGAALKGPDLASFADVSNALVRAGMHPAPERIDGRIESASAASVGHVPIHVQGRARDAQAVTGWMLMAILWGGELRGIGLTPPEGATPEGRDGAFAFDVVDDVTGPLWGRDVVAVAIAPDGAFAELPVEARTLIGSSD